MISRNYDMTGETSFNVAAMAFTYIFVDSGTADQTKVSAYEYNFSTINLQELYGDSFYNTLIENISVFQEVLIKIYLSLVSDHL